MSCHIQKSFSFFLPQIADRETADNIVNSMRPPIDSDGNYSQVTNINFYPKSTILCKYANNLCRIISLAVLILLSSFEIVYQKSVLTYKGMFLSVLVSVGVSTIAISIAGTRIGLNETPFWKPTKFIPTVGMIVSNCMSATALGISSCLSHFRTHRESIETRLSYGACRWEAAKPIAIESVRTAMLPTINGMSILGLISIPGMMTGQIMAGAPVGQAAMYQQIMMFMISGCSAFSVLYCVAICVRVAIDNDHRLRLDRILDGNNNTNNMCYSSSSRLFCCFKRRKVE
ncbi:hypothetical protein INT44_009346, partial [Umbelopsis vinacea]